MIRVLVTGSRDLTDEDLVYEALSDYFEERDWDQMTVTHDGTPGAAELAQGWARLMRSRGVRNNAVKNLEYALDGQGAVLVFHRQGEPVSLWTDELLAEASLLGIRIISYTQG